MAADIVTVDGARTGEAFVPGFHHSVPVFGFAPTGKIVWVRQADLADRSDTIEAAGPGRYMATVIPRVGRRSHLFEPERAIHPAVQWLAVFHIPMQARDESGFCLPVGGPAG